MRVEPILLFQPAPTAPKFSPIKLPKRQRIADNIGVAGAYRASVMEKIKMKIVKKQFNCRLDEELFENKELPLLELSEHCHDLVESDESKEVHFELRAIDIYGNPINDARITLHIGEAIELLADRKFDMVQYHLREELPKFVKAIKDEVQA